MPAGSVAALSAAASAALCWVGPVVIARLPEPAPEAGDDQTDGDVAASAAAKVPYTQIAARPRLRVELAVAGALVGALVGWRLGWEPILAGWVYLGAVGVVLAYVDARTRLLPTRIIAPSYAILGCLVVVAGLLDGDVDRLVRSALGWLVFGGFYVALWLVYPRGLGYGDVRLSGLLGLALGYVGWPAVLTGLYAGFVLGGLGGVVLAALRTGDRRHFAFGPFMLLGSFVGLIWGQSFGGWYTSR